MSKNFEHFRILVCGGDGSVGWVLTEVDKQELTNRVSLKPFHLEFARQTMPHLQPHQHDTCWRLFGS